MLCTFSINFTIKNTTNSPDHLCIGTNNSLTVVGGYISNQNHHNQILPPLQNICNTLFFCYSRNLLCLFVMIYSLGKTYSCGDLVRVILMCILRKLIFYNFYLSIIKWLNCFLPPHKKIKVIFYHLK